MKVYNYYLMAAKVKGVCNSFVTGSTSAYLKIKAEQSWAFPFLAAKCKAV